MGQDKRTLEFLGLFVKHQQEIYAYILTQVPHVHDADDLVQDGMTVMWQKSDQFKPGMNFAACGIPKDLPQAPFSSAVVWVLLDGVVRLHLRYPVDRYLMVKV